MQSGQTKHVELCWTQENGPAKLRTIMGCAYRDGRWAVLDSEPEHVAPTTISVEDGASAAGSSGSAQPQVQTSVSPASSLHHHPSSRSPGLWGWEWSRGVSANVCDCAHVRACACVRTSCRLQGWRCGGASKLLWLRKIGRCKGLAGLQQLPCSMRFRIDVRCLRQPAGPV